MDPKYPEIVVCLEGKDGNAVAIMTRVARALRKHRVPREEIEAFKKEAMSGTYDHLLQTVMAWVEVE